MFLVVHVQTERMPRGVKEYTYVRLWLVRRLLRTELERMRDCCFEVTHLKVEVHHHLLRTLTVWPDRTHIVGRRLEGQVSDSVGWSNGCFLRIILGDLPPEQLRIEPGQGPGVGCLQDNAPPVAPGPTLR